MFLGNSWDRAGMRASVNTAKDRTMATRALGRVSLDLPHR